MPTSEETEATGERRKLETEFETTRAPGLRIADAAKRLKNATDALEWALWATDSSSHAESTNFNHEYAKESLTTSIPLWRKARDELRYALEQDAEAFR